MPELFITGNSSGLGLALTREYLQRGWRVAGLSRRGCPDQGPALRDQRCDLGKLEQIPACLEILFRSRGAPDLVILNAGVLGPIEDVRDTGLPDARSVMDINLWANKVIIDWLDGHGLMPRQLLAISSGAAIEPYRGLGAYALSKTALNMLTGLYALELPDTHFTGLAPGIVDTAMQDALCGVDIQQFPAMASLREARHTPEMPDPTLAAHAIVEIVAKLYDYPSGSFLDVREIQAP